AHHLTAMRGQPIPDHQYLAADVPTQGVKELHDLRPLDRTREEPEVKAIEGDTGHRRELVPVEVILQHGRCAPGRPARTWVGRSPSPDSWMKTMIRPCFLAFFLTPASVPASSVGSLPRRARARDSSGAGC